MACNMLVKLDDFLKCGLTLKLIITDIFKISKFNLSMKGLNSLAYPEYLKVNLLSLLFQLIL